MKKHLLLLVFIANMGFLSAQKKAVTETGEEVILYPDGTWKSLEVKESATTRLDTLVVSKPTTSTFLVKGEKMDYGVWINSKKWTFKKNTKPDRDEEYNFQMMGEDAYMMVIPEKIEIPLAQLKELAFKNAQSAAPDVTIVHEDMRKVNGVLVSCMQMDGTIQGIKFTYFCYYYSGKIGSIQVMTYTSKDLFPRYKKEMENLLNGFVLLKK